MYIWQKTNYMKYLKLLFAFAFAISLSSCDEDFDSSKATRLTGEWYGDFGMYYTYSYKGFVYTFDSYDTDLSFYPAYDHATFGDGIQIDYYAHGPYEYQYYTFNWDLVDGRIFLTYPGAHELDTEIYDYELSSNFFSGYFGNSDVFFELDKVENYYDDYYYSFSGDYYYTPRSNWYSSRYYNTMNPNTNKSATIDDCCSDDDNIGHIVTRGNRYKKIIMVY